MTPKTPEEIADKYCPCGSGGYRHQIGGACSLVGAIRDCVDSTIRAERERAEKALEELATILPMAKAYAFEHNVGNNVLIVAQAESALRAGKGKP